MTQPSISKISHIDTPIGQASLIQHQGQFILSFPTVIDPNNTRSMGTYYGTLRWPDHLPLSRISEFPPGPALPGYLIISLEKMYAEQSDSDETSKPNKPRHVRDFLNNVLAGLAASLFVGKG